MDDHQRDQITVEAGKRGGKPRVRGLRIFPDLEAADICACLAFAAEPRVAHG